MPMAYTTLIDTAALAARIDDPLLAIVDCRFSLSDEEWGERSYEAGHVPGAVYAHLERELSGPKTGTNGRHPLPDPDVLTQTLGRLGIDSSIQVVAYDQDSGAYASRLWWLLRWLGHPNVAVLDGGFAKWTSEGRPVAAGREARAPRTFSGTANPALVVSTDEVARLPPGWTLLDARAPERFRGEVETIDRVAGHIPGALNHPYMTNLDDEGVFLRRPELRARLQADMGDETAERVVCYCGSGVTACHNLLALEHAGLPGARLYPGSWSEWSSDPSRPVERENGTAPHGS